MRTVRCPGCGGRAQRWARLPGSSVLCRVRWCRSCQVGWRPDLARSGWVSATPLVGSLARARAALSLPASPGWDAALAAPALLVVSASLEEELSSYAERTDLLLLEGHDATNAVWFGLCLDRLTGDLVELWAPPSTAPPDADALLASVPDHLAGLGPDPGPVRVRLALDPYKALTSLEVAGLPRLRVSPSSGLAPDRVELSSPAGTVAWHVPALVLRLDAARSEVYDQLRRDGTDPERSGLLAALI